MTVETSSQLLQLDRVSGPAIECPPISPQAGATLGRATDCEIRLPDPSVSRRHASIMRRGQQWFITDLKSHIGTTLNAIRLTPGQPTPLADHDLLAVGPWIFTIVLGETPSRKSIMTEVGTPSSQRVERVSPTELQLAYHRLSLLIDCAALINRATDEKTLADALLQSALEGTGYHRACLIRPVGAGEEIEVLGYLSSDDEGSDRSFSRSLVRMASCGELACLTSSAPVPMGASVAALRITEAICAPIYVGSSINAYLYLDNRGEEAAVQPDAASFCQAIARVGGLSLANLKRAELQQRQDRIVSELAAARDAQGLIMPGERGTVNALTYAMCMRPGRFVAGDLFDVVALEAGRAAVCVGDVCGEGIGAAVLMASVQAHLHATLLQYGEPASALNAVNRYITERSAPDKFVSMWVGVFDLPHGVLRYVDAGHGHWLHRPAGQLPQRVNQGGGIPLGIDSAFRYQAQLLSIGTGDRIIVYSDGIVEQVSAGGEQFGLKRILETLKDCRSAEQDIDVLFQALDNFAPGEDLADDTTVASIECGATGGNA
ncbi:MAG: SpoIIE family protein phosphatase [Phycisphaeraceae bacterium]